VLFESLNLASLLKLPVIFLCENNLWALSTPTSVSLSVADVATRGAAFGMPGSVLDGQDALAVYEGVRLAAERARAGLGPSLLECKTYRFLSHSAFATREVRPLAEIAAWKARDPIPIFAERLRVAEMASETALAAIQRREETTIREAASFALASPLTNSSEAYSDVLVDLNGSRAEVGR
jgi:TPP-dependent pyruvate/acetoin dehydrogenase alpha subunit